eukprot:g4794.t1
MLFNGTKFRMASAEIKPDGCVEIQCSVTDYASYLGTNWNPKFVGMDRAYFADPLGVGCLLVTADDKVCFIRRSKHVGEYPLCLDAPGGHPEPKNVAGCGGDSAWDFDDAGQSNDGGSDEDLSEHVVCEFFDSMLQEIKDECGIPKSSLAELVLLGIIRQLGGSHGRPSLVFRAKCSLTSAQITDLYPSAAEKFETTSLEFRSLASILVKLREDEVAQMTPGCIACVEMFQRSMALV